MKRMNQSGEAFINECLKDEGKVFDFILSLITKEKRLTPCTVYYYTKEFEDGTLAISHFYKAPKALALTLSFKDKSYHFDESGAHLETEVLDIDFRGTDIKNLEIEEE